MSNRTFSVQKSQIHNFLTLSVISGNSEITTMEYQNKNFSIYSIRIKSVWLWFPASPWLNLWLIFLKSLKNSSRDLYNSFCGLESFKKCPSQGRVSWQSHLCNTYSKNSAKIHKPKWLKQVQKLLQFTNVTVSFVQYHLFCIQVLVLDR